MKNRIELSRIELEMPETNTHALDENVKGCFFKQFYMQVNFQLHVNVFFLIFVFTLPQLKFSCDLNLIFDIRNFKSCYFATIL